MGFTRDERIFVLERYFATKSYVRVQSEFVEKFPGSPAPNKSTIKRLVDRFRINGDVRDQTKSQRRKEEDYVTIENLRKTHNRVHRSIPKRKPETYQDEDGALSSTPTFDYEFIGIENIQEEVNDPVTIVSVKFEDEDDSVKEESITDIDSDEKIKQFIEEVRKNPLLYVVNDKNYRNTNLRKNIWAEIAKTCNLPNEVTAQDLWRNLVDNYVITKSTRSNCDDSATSWRYESQMSFLDNEAQLDQSSCAENSAIEYVGIERLNSHSPVATSNIRKSGRVLGNTILQYLDDETNGFQDTVDDDLGLKAFFLSVYHSTQKLNKPQQIRIKKKISDLLFEAEMKSQAFR